MPRIFPANFWFHDQLAHKIPPGKGLAPGAPCATPAPSPCWASCPSGAGSPSELWKEQRRMIDDHHQSSSRGINDWSDNPNGQIDPISNCSIHDHWSWLLFDQNSDQSIDQWSIDKTIDHPIHDHLSIRSKIIAPLSLWSLIDQISYFLIQDHIIDDALHDHWSTKSD